MDLAEQIRRKREAAARARRLLSNVFDEAVRQRMALFAAGLEAEADALEKQPTVTIPASEPALRATALPTPDLSAIPPDPDEKAKR